MTNDTPEPVHPEVVTGDESVEDPAESTITEPTKLIRMASMTRAMLDEVRQAATDEAGRRRLLDVHQRSLDQLRGVLSSDLQEELDGIFLPLRDGSVAPSESELRIAQAQLVGWLEGLFHGIQASLVTQHAAAQRQLMEMRSRDEDPGSGGGGGSAGVYL